LQMEARQQEIERAIAAEATERTAASTAKHDGGDVSSASPEAANP
jgi:hypothetical protein